MDHIVWSAIFLLRCYRSGGPVSFILSDGSVLEGCVHADWISTKTWLKVSHKLSFTHRCSLEAHLKEKHADSIKAMSTPCIYILVVSLLQELALRSSLIMSPVTIVQEVEGGLATFDTHEADGVLEVETEENPPP